MTTEYPKCIRCGFCCKKATCIMGLARGAALKGCTFLVGDRPGDYACQLILDDPSLGEHVAIGGGCSSTLFNDDRKEVFMRDLPEWRQERLRMMLGPKLVGLEERLRKEARDGR